jgi:sulfur-oxidizing protein SoxY
MTPDDHVTAIHLIVDKNPDIHLAAFELTPAVGLASIDTRIKMRATSHVRAIAETSRGEVWWATRKVFPATNGCG